MGNPATFVSFEKELNRLIIIFERNLPALKSAGYDEASLRQEFLNPFFRALGWDMENKAGLILAHREVIAESRTDTGRADYLFQTDRKRRFVCEAKKPAEELHPHAQQAKGYAWTIGVPFAVLTDFEELRIYIVGSEPEEDEPLVGLWKTYQFREYLAKARELWDLLARDNVACGSIDRAIESLPKKPLRLGKGQFVIRPDPTQSFDAKFLGFLDDARRSLASDLIRQNDRADLLEGTRLNDAVQCILDRLLFIRISEARGIDMGTKLESLLETWQRRNEQANSVREPPAHWGGAGLKAPKGSLWHVIVRHKRKKDVCWFDAKTNTLHLTVRTKRRILRETIYGVDIDRQAVEVTQLSLYLKMLEGETSETLQREQDLFGADEPILPSLQENIKNFNSLIGHDFSIIPEDLVRVNAKDWDVQFASIMKSGGFDAVVGNPPYIRIQTMQESDPESVAYLNQHYTAAKKGNYDIYVCFVERVLSLVNKHGTMGFILPHKFFNAQYGEGLREVISNGKHLRRVVHFGHQQVFEGATTYTCLLFLDKSPQESFTFASVSNLATWSEKGVSQERKFPHSDTQASEWNFNSGPDAGLIERLFKLPVKLSDVAHLFVGLQTDADDVFILELVRQSSNELVCFSRATEKEHKFEREHLKLLLKGSLNVRRYELDSVTKRLIFPYEIIDNSSVVISERDYKKRFPKTWRYLEENRGRLSKRNKGKQPDGWHGYVYKKNHTRLGSPKIVVPSLGTGSCFALDSTGQHYFVGSGAGGGGGYGIVPTNSDIGDIRFLLGLLNSRLLSFLIKKTSTPFRGGYIALNRQYIERLPIQLVDLKTTTGKGQHDKLVGLVDKMLVLTPKLRAAKSDAERATLQNAVTATDRQIDRLVYELYGLTDEEIQLVEETA
ncbi:MAG: hypothetical protein PCFJNLEI_03299 [Verrucomicrobiae bacterium]|nr:hypothetical protein [Verrucomicrobiae bacterium]